MSRRLSILGSTGSIGQSSLSVVSHANAVASEPAFEIEALTAHTNVELLASQAIEFGARTAVIGEARFYGALKSRLAGTGIEALAGASAIEDVARVPVDRVVASIVGIAGLASTHAALEAGNDIALANKESMVCAGPLLKQVAAKTGARIVPTDSEHNAMFQVMERAEDVDRLILTASGGPFLRTPLGKLAKVTPEEACAHPRWSMGRKISVDSASFMNKALELIEASYLFDVPESRIDVLVHPQSIIHSLVSYIDGSFLAQLGSPDMQTPIAHALSWPNGRVPTAVERLDLAAISRLEFENVDDHRFPSIRLARAALNESDAAVIVLNASNEEAVGAFLGGRCKFTDINRVNEKAVSQLSHRFTHGGECLSLDGISHIDREARKLARELVSASMAGAKD
ncbi:1-deoxy-D-xylulose-5-phosphate reductoisomerase [Henriciella marina]|uniref:1-deoxy-D-xylulose 5-phosphate reductoisomerase n=1 Tax=Henriciella marina TaxID=453851 RepID=A0ABT4LXG9_9PROT|nr:1-deoxy-D-xylulose-5-phosphate reductoisomerase [Henriciella marina]MCZ4299079.1 1-deoxy-D-xylulose-5-phosphate reductoisomerase [Henriciella marina]